MKKNKSSKIINPRARYDYDLGDEIIVGIALNGKETKSLRQGRGNLRGAFVNLKDGELFLVNATITSGKTFIIPDTEQTRTRKLLATKKQLQSFTEAKEQGRTIVPIEILTKGRFVKVKIASGKGKKVRDKREVIKERDLMRDAQRSIKR